MSWSIYAKGGPKAVAAIVKNQARYGCQTNPDGTVDEKALNPWQRQCRAVAGLILDELNRLSFGPGVLATVNASGSLHNGRGQIRVEISQADYNLDTPEEPEAAAPEAPKPITVTVIPEPAPAPTEPTPAPTGDCPDCGGLEHTRGCPRY